jgi:hypothetical protein
VNTLVDIKGEGCGYADETLSARSWRLRHVPGGRGAVKIIDTLFFWQEGHCRQAYESKVQRRQLPREYRRDKWPA